MHDTRNCSTFKGKLERMFKCRELPLSKVAQKPKNDKNLLGDHDSNFIIIDDEEDEWDAFIYIPNVNGPKLKVCIPT